MATAESLSRRRDLAGRSIERRVKGLARVQKIQLPPVTVTRYPDAQHREADRDERIAAILTAVLRSLDPKAAELRDDVQGVINEYREEPDMAETQSHSGEEPKKGVGTFKQIQHSDSGATVKVQRAADQPAPEPLEGTAGLRTDDDLESMKAAELREQAKTAGVQGASSMSKQELVDALSKQQQVNSGNLDVLTVAELKDRANAAGIHGASGMNKAELVDALNKQPK